MTLLPDVGAITPRPHVALGELLTQARERALEFERERQISEDYYLKLKDSGIMRILVPSELGGLDGSFVDWFEAVERLAFADASVGWVAAHGAITSSIIGVVAGPELASEFFADVSSSAAWSNLGSIECTVSAEGLLISGRWSFVTGCRFATYVGGLVKVPGKGVVSVLLPRSETIIEPNWNPIGLAGTGSHDVVVEGALVPWSRTVSWPQPWTAEPTHSERSISPYRVLAKGTWPISLTCAATQLGLARRALAEIDRSLATKRDSYTNKPLSSKPHLIPSLEDAHAQLILCRNAFERVLDKAWNQANLEQQLDKTMRTELRLGCIAVTHGARDIVRAAFDAGGAGALSRDAVFEKLYRDSSCLTSHVSASRSGFEVTSSSRFSEDPGAWI